MSNFADFHEIAQFLSDRAQGKAVPTPLSAQRRLDRLGGDAACLSALAVFGLADSLAPLTPLGKESALATFVPVFAGLSPEGKPQDLQRAVNGRRTIDLGRTPDRG